MATDHWTIPVEDVAQAVSDQLPEGVRKKLGVRVERDAYGFRAKAKFSDAAGRSFECELEAVEFSGRLFACRVPETFITHLCAVV